MEELIHTLTGYLSECVSIEKSLNQIYSVIALEMKKQRALYLSILSLEQELNEMIEAISKKKIYLEETAKSHIISRTLRFIYTVGVKRDLSKLKSTFQKSHSDYINQVKLYNEQSVTIMNSLKNPELLSFKNKYRQLLEKLAPYNQLKVEFDSPYSAITYNMRINQLSWSIMELDDFRTKCSNAKVNIKKASSAISEWEHP